MSFMKVNYGTLETSQAEIKSISGNIDSKLAELKKMLAKLQWEGSDEAAYRELQGRWDRSVADLNMVLGQIGHAVDVAKQNYMATEAGNRASFGG